MRSDSSLSKRVIGLVTVSLLSACQPAPTAEPEVKPAAQGSFRVADDASVSSNVAILDEIFAFPETNPRRIWVYTPPDYAQSSARYPVVYMHDGQNVFSQQTSYAGEWRVDETLDRLAGQGESVPIVVAIDHGGDRRVQELSPWTHPKYSQAEGEAYLAFLINEVKPYMDTHYRTLASSRYTAIMGSSMGGLLSHYAIVKHPDVFSRAAILSPSFWFSEKAFSFAETQPLPDTHRLYFSVGEKEGSKMTDSMTAMVNLHLAQQHPTDAVYSEVVPGQAHNETFWQTRVEPALRWLGLLSITSEEIADAR